MCRFVLYLGPPIRISSLLVEPDHSLIHQSYHSRERTEPLNGDGFGFAFYAPDVDPEPGLFRSITPAWSNLNMLNLARVVRSGCIAAHVRAATPGLPVTELNCHPFRRRRFTFMHNGEIGGFARIKREMCRSLSDEAYAWIRGSTDSEHFFAVFIDAYLARVDRPGGGEAQRIADALENAVTIVSRMAADAGVTEPSFLNLAVADGERAVVTRYTDAPDAAPHSLYACTGDSYVCENGACRMVTTGAAPSVALIASEPLGRDPRWEPIPKNHMMLVEADRTIETRPMRVEATCPASPRTGPPSGTSSA